MNLMRSVIDEAHEQKGLKDIVFGTTVDNAP
jgi:hypothetical protein